MIFILVVGAGGTWGGANAQPPQREGNEADAAYREGRFDEARTLYEAQRKEQPDDAGVLLRLGELALYDNRLEEAIRCLEVARRKNPDDPRIALLLGECHYRRDAFRDAARHFRRGGRKALADKLESFGEGKPYRVEGEVDVARIPFLMTDPLPLIEVRVNERENAFFLIDTGAGEIILDPELADRVGAVRFGAESGRFAGDKTASYEHGRIASIQLGPLLIRDLPVHLLSTKNFSAVTGGRRVDGIVGTVLLYHFFSTLDYPAGELILRRKNEIARSQIDRLLDDPRSIAVPIRLAGDHFVLGVGSLNRAQPCLMFLDTGLAGGGFTAPYSTLEAAGVKLSESYVEGIGGGGKVRITPFVAEAISLGSLYRTNIMSFAGAFPASLEHGFGFRIGGLVSHAFFRPYAVTLDFERMRLLAREGK